MTKTLIVSASPFKDSVSSYLAKEFAEMLPDEQKEFMDIANTEFPVYTQRLHEELTGISPRTKEMKNDLSAYDDILETFISSDKIVIAFPNWNLFCPANLISFVLGATRINKTFACTSEGYKGLLHNKKALIILSSGGVILSKESCYALEWLENVLRMNGINNITTITADGFEQFPERTDEIKENALIKLREIAKNF